MPLIGSAVPEQHLLRLEALHAERVAVLVVQQAAAEAELAHDAGPGEG